MAVDNFIYQGINRAVSDYTGARACEELINLRPTEGGLVPVKDFTPKFSNVAWDRVFVHYTTSGPKYIVVKRGSSAVEVYYLTNASDPTSLSSLFSVTGLNTDAKMNDVLEHLYFAAAGNILLFSICAPTAGVYENHAFIWKMDDTLQTPAERYVGMEAKVPQINFQVKDNNTATGATSSIYSAYQSIAQINKYSSVSECTDAVQSGLNALQEENSELCLGPILIAIAYKTTDGQTFWTENWTVYDPIRTIQTDPVAVSNYYYAASSPSTFFDPFFDKYGSGYLIGMTGDNYEYLNEIMVYGTHVRIELSQLDTTHPAYANYWNKNTSTIQSVEIYCSQPQCYLNPEGAKDGLFEMDQTHHGYHLYVPQTPYDEMALGNQILYFQASVPMESLAEGAQTVNPTFGSNIQMTEETLDADAGALQRFGRILSYNARFHYFDSVAKIKIGMPSFTYAVPYSTVESQKPKIFVRYADDDQSGLVCLGTYPVNEPMGEAGAYAVIAPSLNIKEVLEYFTFAGGYFVRTYRMTPSSTYNYAICQDGGEITEGSASPIAKYANATVDDIVTNVETDAINVTEQYNPFVFRVEHSYKAPGNVIDVQPQMAGVVDASYGRDPLNVFTERGLYALTQGSADVLYGAFLPLSNLKAQRGGIPVEAGTFFLADGALWLVSGRRVTLISEALSEGPHKYIRACNGYRKLSGTDTGFSLDGTAVTPVADPVYDVSPYLSKTEFKIFVSGDAAATTPIPAGRLGYNRHRMEIFVSNPAYGYTYVLSLKNYQWYKISKRLWQDEPGSTIVNIPGLTSGTITVMDMSQEVSQSETPLLIHMQSRPFSMGYQYAHVHRIVTMMRAKLENAGQKVAVGLYGSDDLQHWNLLSYGKWAGKTEENPTTHETTDTPLYLSQMRTPSSARSWRYYTVCIGGYIPVTPDFPTAIGPVLVDYKPVVRRLG